MDDLVLSTEQTVCEIGSAYNLEVAIEYCDVFKSTENSPVAMEKLLKAAEGFDVMVPEKPFRWSEDFGQFAAVSDSAIFGIGAGEIPELHHPDYDFPDDLISIGADFFLRIVQSCGCV